MTGDSQFSDCHFSQNSQFSHIFYAYQHNVYCEILFKLAILLHLVRNLPLAKNMTKLRIDCINKQKSSI